MATLEANGHTHTQALSHTGHPNWPVCHWWGWGTVWEPGSTVPGPRAPGPLAGLWPTPGNSAGREKRRLRQRALGQGSVGTARVLCAFPLERVPCVPRVAGSGIWCSFFGHHYSSLGTKNKLGYSSATLRRPVRVSQETSHRPCTVREKPLTLLKSPSGRRVTMSVRHLVQPLPGAFPWRARGHSRWKALAHALGFGPQRFRPSSSVLGPWDWAVSPHCPPRLLPSGPQWHQ